MLKKRLFLLVFAGSTILGCVKGPSPPHSAWPWGRDNDYDSLQTGGYISATANVAEFGAAPAAAKPADVEVLVGEKAPAASVPETPVLPAATTTPSEKQRGEPTTSVFTITDIPVLHSSNLAGEMDEPSRDITADNAGTAPVSVAIVLDPASRNVAANKTLPVYAVVEPGGKETVLRLSPKIPKDRLVRGTVSSSAGSREHIVFFQIPKETPLLPARKGMVVRIKTSQVDILHDDGTIGTYRHIGKMAEGLVVGKEVSTDENIGVVCRLGKEEQGYVELSVWAPRLPVDPSPRAARAVGFDFVSFPLNFCSAGWSSCRPVKDGEVVSRNAVTVKQNNRKRQTRRAALRE